MKFSIYTMNDNGSGMEYVDKEQFLNEISAMVDDCIANGGTYFSVEIDTDASCFCDDDANECPLGGDVSNDCAGCTYGADCHYVDGECVSRHI